MRWSELDADLTPMDAARRARQERQSSIRCRSSPGREASFSPICRASPVRDFVFTTTGTTSVSGYSRAKRCARRCHDGTERWHRFRHGRLHDLRRSMASHMARLGVQLPVIEKILNHISGPSFGGVAGVYQRHSFEDEKRAGAGSLGAAFALARYGFGGSVTRIEELAPSSRDTRRGPEHHRHGQGVDNVG